jgi:3-phenylpropionate/trans-cinnamate dioxygenase ferredoxin subunit
MTTHSVLSLDELVPGTARKVEIGSRPVCLVRIGDDVYAIADTCSHAEISLSEGEVLADSCEIECWKHGSAFDLRTGRPSTLPATRPVAVYDVAIVDGHVVVTIDEETR